MSELPVREPRRTIENAPFWDGCARDELILPKCDACGEYIWYPRRFCPFCASREVSWTPVSGRGTVYSFTIQRKGSGPYREAAPYLLAYVELEEGPRVLTNIVGAAPESVHIGQAVRVVFDHVPEGGAIPRFTPA